jgi:hypothetical protein
MQEQQEHLEPKLQKVAANDGDASPQIEPSSICKCK